MGKAKRGGNARRGRGVSKAKEKQAAAPSDSLQDEGTLDLDILNEEKLAEEKRLAEEADRREEYLKEREEAKKLSERAGRMVDRQDLSEIQFQLEEQEWERQRNPAQCKSVVFPSASQGEPSAPQGEPSAAQEEPEDFDVIEATPEDSRAKGKKRIEGANKDEPIDLENFKSREVPTFEESVLCPVNKTIRRPYTNEDEVVEIRALHLMMMMGFYDSLTDELFDFLDYWQTRGMTPKQVKSTNRLLKKFNRIDAEYKETLGHFLEPREVPSLEQSKYFPFQLEEFNEGNLASPSFLRKVADQIEEALKGDQAEAQAAASSSFSYEEPDFQGDNSADEDYQPEEE